MTNLFQQPMQVLPRLFFVGFVSIAAITMAGCFRASNHDSDRDAGNEDHSQWAQVTDKTFAREVLGHPSPVVVVMGTRWCPECLKAKPTLQKLSREYADRIRFREVDVESNSFLSEKYDITQYPTLLLFFHGEEKERLVGKPDLTTLKERFREVFRFP